LQRSISLYLSPLANTDPYQPADIRSNVWYKYLNPNDFFDAVRVSLPAGEAGTA
jgi:hypothetical protein